MRVIPSVSGLLVDVQGSLADSENMTNTVSSCATAASAERNVTSGILFR